MFKYFTLLSVTFLSLSSVTHAQVFYDDFKSSVDTTIWHINDTKWGENPAKGTQGGVVPENVIVKNGHLKIRALGDYYSGPVKGHGQNTKVGGAITTIQRFASGSFEVKAKLCPRPGALSAFWTYYNENDDYNHEIDFEFPGHNKPPYAPDSSDLHYGLLTNWTGVHEDQYYTKDMYFGNQIDGQFHLYRFDWHTGGNGEKPRIEYYYDNKLMYTSYEHIPTHASNFNVGIWFPNWIKKADFISDYMYVDWVKITPFHEPNDVK
ncbi:glycoside hydrolase family 16 protein [Mucilaginibacter sp. X5P1]|uniref:glycoside hydrolase family 16 protein n=1 Tax=Mucilaginibacter sp. X5P1 TaxID=2723088 RepID=UPI00160C5DEA|nr:glycoside hydrolase family 16 protein [Mucilaginibacter sp. X5P1]MBB6138627.1 beta-glucanase (GH16 family) [Mucilaginibacter sp. X5P1]